MVLEFESVRPPCTNLDEFGWIGSNQCKTRGEVYIQVEWNYLIWMEMDESSMAITLFWIYLKYHELPFTNLHNWKIDVS